MSNLNKFGVPHQSDNVSNSFNRGYQTPTDFVDLPSQGLFYPKGSPLHGVDKVEVSFMTAVEEDILVSPGLEKAGLTIDRVLQSLLVDKRIRTQDLLIGDKNAILINARKNAFGDEYEFSYKCTECETINKHTENFNNVGIKDIIKNSDVCSSTENGTITIVLPKTKAIVELKFLNGEDEIAIEQTIEKKRKNNLPAETLLTRYRHMFVSINGNKDLETIISFSRSMPMMDSLFLRNRYTEMNPDISFKYEAECKKCKCINKGGVPIMADFFWPEL